jgi:N-methylhydantoinase B
MNISVKQATVDPILAEVIRTRLEAIGQEAAIAVEQTAISPIVTESKDYSVVICDARGALVLGKGAIEVHFGAAMHAVQCTIRRHHNSIQEGDVFIANDPHSDGGLHPQDVVIQKPVFVDGQLVAWVALCAHMMDMGGMVPGSSAANATECFQEALRLPSVRLYRAGVENTETWEIIATNIRSAALITMDMRSLVIGANVAEGKLVKLIAEIGAATFDAVAQTLNSSTERVLRERVSRIDDGRYRLIAWAEYGPKLFRIPVELVVSGDRLVFDLREAPPQAPHFFNSKPYIVQTVIVPRIRALLAADLPINQAIYNVIELSTTPGTLVDSVVPAPIAAAHMDAALAVACTAVQCLQVAIHASPRAWGRQYNTGPQLSAYGTGRWSYMGDSYQRHVFTILDGALGGSPAGCDRDGMDLSASLTPWGVKLEYADIEILELAYPMIFHERRVRHGAHGYGQYRSGAGCEEAFSPHGTDQLLGNMTGTRAWFASPGLAGGMPGGTTSFRVVRADGAVEELSCQSTGVNLTPGDRFETKCATGGGFGDPLDRDVSRIMADMQDNRVDRQVAEQVYGVVFAADGTIDARETATRRAAIRADRLRRATPAPVAPPKVDKLPDVAPLPLYPGIVQYGRYAVAEQSGAILAVAPHNWLNGCPVLSSRFDKGDIQVVSRSYLDPVTGKILHLSVDRADEGVPMEIAPDRWAGTATSRAAE